MDCRLCVSVSLLKRFNKSACLFDFCDAVTVCVSLVKTYNCINLFLCVRVFVSLQSLPEVLSSNLVRVQVKACGLSPLDLKVRCQNLREHD